MRDIKVEVERGGVLGCQPSIMEESLFIDGLMATKAGRQKT